MWTAAGPNSSHGGIFRYRQFGDLSSEISLELNADDAVLDGEIVKLGESGRPVFIDLMR
jgi:ATP-dependent DNA ligase